MGVAAANIIAGTISVLVILRHSLRVRDQEADDTTEADEDSSLNAGRATG